MAMPLPAACTLQIYILHCHTSLSWMCPIIAHLTAACTMLLLPLHLYSHIAAPLQPHRPHCCAPHSCMAMFLPPLQLHTLPPPIAAAHAQLLHALPLYGPCCPSCSCIHCIAICLAATWPCYCLPYSCISCHPSPTYIAMLHHAP